MTLTHRADRPETNSPRAAGVALTTCRSSRAFTHYQRLLRVFIPEADRAQKVRENTVPSIVDLNAELAKLTMFRRFP